MKIQFASDLHLEFPENRHYLEQNPIKPTGDVLILAGDIVPFVQLEKYLDFFKQWSDQFRKVWWVPGNHEYYRSDITQRSKTLMEKILPNCFLVNQVTLIEGNIRLIFTTLWSNIGPIFKWDIEKGFSDFRLIRHHNDPFTIAHYNALHQECLDFLEKELSETWSGKTVVVTHHCPTFTRYPSQFLGSPFNEGFATELKDKILQWKPDYWIYGHVHHSDPDYYLGKTRMLCNTLGYVELNEHGSFKPDKVFKT